MPVCSTGPLFALDRNRTRLLVVYFVDLRAMSQHLWKDDSVGKLFRIAMHPLHDQMDGFRVFVA